MNLPLEALLKEQEQKGQPDVRWDKAVLKIAGSIAVNWGDKFSKCTKLGLSDPLNY